MIEATEKKGSVGTFYIANALRIKGHSVDFVSVPQSGYDYELFSVHHVTEYKKIVQMPQKSKIRIIGGHALYSNPRPLVPFADLLCLGEWDTGLNDLEALTVHENVIKRIGWQNGQALPCARIESPLPKLIPYLNHENTGSVAWYIELARGCPFSCTYCELGNSVKFRPYSKEQILEAIQQCDLSKTRKINLFAPDEASCTFYDELEDFIKVFGGYTSTFRSMRVDTFNKNIHRIKNNVLVRLGIDGLTEETRFRVGKKIKDFDLVNFFESMTEKGHVNFKIFMIFGYPWEQIEDFKRFERVMERILRIELKKNSFIRIKWTPFIPQPSTPLAGEKPIYSQEMVEKINNWHTKKAKPKQTPGFFVSCDGIMSSRSHRDQVDLMTATENYFLTGI